MAENAAWGTNEKTAEGGYKTVEVTGKKTQQERTKQNMAVDASWQSSGTKVKESLW